MKKQEWSDKNIEDFWSKVDKLGPLPEHIPSLGRCWAWTGSISGRYGCFRHSYAHRIAYRLSFDEPGALLVCHKCDNTFCCNPSHLFLGTHKDNTRDMLQKGRQGGKGAEGESNYGAILTESEVIHIRNMFASGESRESLMESSKITRGSLNKILRRCTWKHI